ncbi:MAG TPA: hypothetical protein VIR60_10375 [Gammaproteobacteria bacterium]
MDAPLHLEIYVDHADTAARVQLAVEQLAVPCVVHRGDVEPAALADGTRPPRPVLLANGGCHFFSPAITTEEFKVLLKSCLLAEDLKRYRNRTARRS